MNIEEYNTTILPEEQIIAKQLFSIISSELPQSLSKIWHAHPVWFINNNPIVGYSKEKKGIRLMFWSGADFNEDELNVRGKKFKDASIFYTHADEIKIDDLKRWLQKSITIQYDYQNIIKRKGQLIKLDIPQSSN